MKQMKQMKQVRYLALYGAASLVGLWAFSCRQGSALPSEHEGQPLTVRVALLGGSAWSSRSASEPRVYGGSVDVSGSDYRILGYKEAWRGSGVEEGSDSATAADSGSAGAVGSYGGPSAEAPVTRGTPIGSASGIKTLRVNVYRTGTSSWGESSSRTASLDATYASGGFTTSPAYNWPADPVSRTTLFAYAPLPSESNGLSEQSSPHKLRYVVPTAVAAQPDFCAAVPDKDVVNSDGTRQVRTFGLRHCLTAVGFRMLGWNLKITSISVSGVYTEGVFDMNSSSWGSLASKGSRSVGVTQSNCTHTHTDTPADITQSDGYLMMIPQALADDAEVTIVYTATTTDATEGTLKAKLKDLGVTWGAGDKVTYDIRLKTAPAVTSGALTISTHLAGYTTTSPLTVSTDYLDNLTFTWPSDQSWLRVWRGGPTTGTSPSGWSSGWSTGVGGPWSNIYFYATNENTSTTSTRSATVTVIGTRSGKKTFTVTQAKKPVNYVKIGNLYWAVGNLVANGSNGCKVGAPTDYGLYFHFGSLVGWSGGSNGDGTGQGSPSMSQRVKPSGYSGSSSWPAGYYTGGSASTGYGLPSTDVASTGIGDPCRYYLGGSWRTPTAAEYQALDAAGQGSWTTNGGVNGRWFGPSSGSASSSSVFVPASGNRDYSSGAFTNVTTSGYCWSSSVTSATLGYSLYFYSSAVYPQGNFYRSNGFPVRCVSTAP